MKKHSTIIFVLLSFILSSCSDEISNIPNYLVQKKDFQNTIIIEGIAEPLNSTTILSPRAANGGGTVSFIIENGTLVKEGDIVCQIENQELQNNYDRTVIELENAMAGYEKTKADLELQYALLEAQARNNEAETQIARLDSSHLEYYSPNQRKVKELELRKVSIEKRKIDSKLAALSIIQKSEIRKLEVEIQRKTAHVKDMKDFLESLTLRAPKPGVALRATSYRTGTPVAIGEMVWFNFPLVNIPELTHMKIKIMAPEMDYRYISIGDSVNYIFDALPDNIAWGKITGKVPVGTQLTQNSKIKFFEITASIDSTLKMPEPGYTANTNITLKQVKDTIVIPQITIFDQDSIKVVYVAKKNGYEMRQVALAESSAKEVVIARGLNTDEKIALSRPKESNIKSRTRFPVDTVNTKTTELK